MPTSPMQPRYFPPLIAGLATVGLALVMSLFFSGATGHTWGDLPLGKAGLTAEYCEYNRMEAFIRQPVNAWSNLAYFFLGMWMLVVGVTDARRKSDHNPLTRFPAMTSWLGLMLVGLCFGSFFFHASVTQLGQHWDMAFTYAVALGLIAGAGYRCALLLGARETTSLRLAFLAGAVMTAVLMYLIKWYVDGKLALPTMMLLGVGLAVTVYVRRRPKLDGRLLLAGIVMLVLSGVFRTLDLAKVGCDPMGWMQLHAAWHACTGLSACLFWGLLHREKP